MFAYIVHRHGQPLMPCSPRKARLLLKAGKAKVIKMVPFSLQLRYGSSGYKQEVSLGIDAGTRHLGVSATTEKAVLFEAEVQPRSDIQALLATRRQFRHARRSRKTRYRKSRFRNRRKPEGWLAPSVEHKVAVNLKTIRLIHQIKHYQEGPQLGFWNTREYVLWYVGRSHGDPRYVRGLPAVGAESRTKKYRRCSVDQPEAKTMLDNLFALATRFANHVLAASKCNIPALQWRERI